MSPSAAGDGTRPGGEQLTAGRLTSSSPRRPSRSSSHTEYSIALQPTRSRGSSTGPPHRSRRKHRQRRAHPRAGSRTTPTTTSASTIDAVVAGRGPGLTGQAVGAWSPRRPPAGAARPTSTSSRSLPPPPMGAPTSCVGTYKQRHGYRTGSAQRQRAHSLRSLARRHRLVRVAAPWVQDTADQAAADAIESDRVALQERIDALEVAAAEAEELPLGTPIDVRLEVAPTGGNTEQDTATVERARSCRSPTSCSRTRPARSAPCRYDVATTSSCSRSWRTSAISTSTSWRPTSSTTTRDRARRRVPHTRSRRERVPGRRVARRLRRRGRLNAQVAREASAPEGADRAAQAQRRPTCSPVIDTSSSAIDVVEDVGLAAHRQRRRAGRRVRQDDDARGRTCRRRSTTTGSDSIDARLVQLDRRAGREAGPEHGDGLPGARHSRARGRASAPRHPRRRVMQSTVEPSISRKLAEPNERPTVTGEN